ncbi:unnamed protein product [Closterium sp. NIES-53]
MLACFALLDWSCDLFAGAGGAAGAGAPVGAGVGALGAAGGAIGAGGAAGVGADGEGAGVVPAGFRKLAFCM